MEFFLLLKDFYYSYLVVMDNKFLIGFFEEDWKYIKKIFVLCSGGDFVVVFVMFIMDDFCYKGK